MIEGLRLLPWFQEYVHRQPRLPVIANCDKCMQATTQITRQGRGCGYEPAAPAGIRVVPWQPPLAPFVKLGYRHGTVTLCAGYTTKLPEVAEAARARDWATRGQLDVFLGGERANENLLAYIDILDVEVNAMELCASTPRDKGGSRE